MSDRPTEPVDPTTPEQGERPDRSLSEILEELALLSHAQQGEASEMRSAVSELSRALARLFEMIRTDRREQHGRIAQLERELEAAREQLAALGVEPLVPPAPNDFDQLRAAAERLRIRTQQLVRDAELPADEPVTDAPAPAPPRADDEEHDAELGASGEPEAPLAPVVEAGVLRVLPGAAADPVDADLEVESELPLAREQAVAVPVRPADEDAAPAEVADRGAVPSGGEASGDDRPGSEPTPEAVVEDDAPTPAAEQPAPTAARPEPIAIAPRPERKRRFSARRRRLDARKLTDVEPTAALGSMVGAVQQLWTAGCPLDLVIAFTDGGAVLVTGGDRAPLRVEEVEPGTPARCTITATRRQLVPLFGRLELTDAESAPLIHGSRRDADLLVGWFDRAQRLSPEPL